ncbi:MAG: hypothetical protein GF315_09980 [candidate division Zixibacteria bacterium]|nr:hypothetical protein [candidate division Zixibacteria bacterium]
MTVAVPGKVMLSGEYAVLYGGSAVLSPVPRYLKVAESDSPTPENENPIVKNAMQYPIPELLDCEHNYPLRGVNVDRSDFYFSDGRAVEVKLGIGSSAAEAVGVIALRFERAGLSWDRNKRLVAKYAIDSHTIAQGGRGSGADVAVSAYGEPIIFKRSEGGISIKVLKTQSPDYRIPINLVWTGKSADTREFVTKFNQWVKISGRDDKQILKNMIAKSDELVEQWFKAPPSELYDILDEYTSLVMECCSNAGISYRMPVHDELKRWAVDNGGYAKPTGAGGGDMVLLLGELPLNELSSPCIEVVS